MSRKRQTQGVEVVFKALPLETAVGGGLECSSQGCLRRGSSLVDTPCVRHSNPHSGSREVFLFSQGSHDALRTALASPRLTSFCQAGSFGVKACETTV